MIVSFATIVIVDNRAAYTYENKYGQLWELADKSSTISAKYSYINEFVIALEKGYTNGDFADYNATFLQTPNNSFQKNLEALKTLSERLGEIREMNPSSFEYNTAIQQITAQEQGEADAILAVFKGCYNRENYPITWGWIGNIFGIFTLLCSLIALFGSFFFLMDN